MCVCVREKKKKGRKGNREREKIVIECYREKGKLGREGKECIVKGKEG